MDTVEFVATTSQLEDYKVVDIYINGINFIEMLHQLELPLAYQEGVPEMAGAYEGLPPLSVLPPSRHFYGEADASYLHDNKVTLLEYAYSGVPGDWPLAASISADKDKVYWKDFEQIRRNKLKNGYLWTYEVLGAFVFDRQQYHEALIRAKEHAY